jgi:hypothetical protein
MSKIIDPDLLNQGVEVVFNTTTKKIQLLVIGNLSTDGVSLQCLYSFAKEEWHSDASLFAHLFPFEALGEEKFELKYGWTFADQSSIDLIRDAGFAVVAVNGDIAEMYMCVITLGTIGSADQVYYQQTFSGAPSNIVLSGVVNQCVKVYGDVTNGNVDYRGYMKLFVREEGKTYAQTSHIDIGVSEFTYQAYRFGLQNQADGKVTHTDAEVVAYTGITATWYAAPQTRIIGGVSYNFDVVIDAANHIAEEVYEYVQFLLRQTSDIDSGAAATTGTTADALLKFNGETLVTSAGVYIDNFNATDTNRLEFVDLTSATRTFPFVAAGVIAFNDNLLSSASSIYRMYITDTFGSATPVVVNDASGTPIEGSVVSSSASFTFDYDGNTQNGRTAGVDMDITLVAIGTDKGQYTFLTGKVVKSTANSYAFVSALERVYRNPT